MTTFREVSEAWIASKEHCAGSWAAFNFGSISSALLPSQTSQKTTSIVLWRLWWPEVKSNLAETGNLRHPPVSPWREAPSTGSFRPWQAFLSMPDGYVPYPAPTHHQHEASKRRPNRSIPTNTSGQRKSKTFSKSLGFLTRNGANYPPSSFWASTLGSA